VASKTTQRTLKNLRDRGYRPCVAEYYNARQKRKHDLYKWIDVVAIHPHERGVLGVQTTTAAHLAERVRKAEKLEAYWEWLGSGNVAEFQGWKKVKHETKNMKVWRVKIIRVDWRDMLW